MAYRKYHNRRVEYEGIVFDSLKEKRRYCQLQLMEKQGIISDLRLQVPYELLPAIYEDEIVKLKTKTKIVKRCVQKSVKYVADFVYKDRYEYEIVEDVKGQRTKEYILKKKMMRALLGITITEV